MASAWRPGPGRLLMCRFPMHCLKQESPSARPRCSSSWRSGQPTQRSPRACSCPCGRSGATCRRWHAMSAAPSADRSAPAPAVRPVPVPLTSFVGRATEVAELTGAVRAHRLVTATGPGGVGKTRLAAEVAALLASDLRDGVWYVDLVPVSDDALVAAAVHTA